MVLAWLKPPLNRCATDSVIVNLARNLLNASTMERSTTFVEKAAIFVLGLLVAVSLQIVNGWWLNSGEEVLRTILVLFALGLLVASWRSGRPWVRACALWAGAISGMTVALFWIGPGTIWPIVLVAASVMSAGAVFGGALLGFAVNKLRH